METPFTPLLSTNYVPTVDELCQIKSLLVNPLSHLGELDAELLRLEEIFNNLGAKREKLYEDIVAHQALAAPLRRIPEELLQEIFVRCLPTQHNAVMSTDEAPLLLGRVCRQWRRVSLSTPALWSSIHIAVTEDPPSWSWGDPGPRRSNSHIVKDASVFVEGVKIWLGRSGALPLSITLFHPSSFYNAEDEKQLVLSLIPFSNRWKHISIFASSASFPTVASLTREDVPILETLFVHNVTSTSPPDINPPTPCDIYRAPLLRVASSSHPTIIPADSNWSQLTSLALESQGHGLEGLNPRRGLEILRKCPNLIECRLEFIWTPPAWPTDGIHETVTVPLLETLAIKEGITNLKPFFEHLNLPSLINLEFTSGPTNYHVWQDVPDSEPFPLATLLARVTTLQGLTISAHNTTRDNLIECLSNAPSISRLSVLSPPTFSVWSSVGWQDPGNLWHPFDDQVLTFLSAATNIGLRTCPHLKILEANPGDVSDVALYRFIEMRTKGIQGSDIEPLERVSMNFRREKEMDVVSQISPDILKNTEVDLVYWEPLVHHKRLTPWAGLDRPGKLEMSTKRFRHHF